MTINIRRIPAPNTLIIFEASARHLSFTRAAAELCLTPAAVSKQVQQLESRLHVPLFVRGHRSLTLTAQGARLYDAVFSALGQVADAVAEVRSPQSDLVAIASSSAIANLWLLPRLDALTQAFPQCSIRFMVGEANQGPLPAGADLTVRYTSAQMAGDGAQLMFPIEIFPVCSPAFQRKHRLRRVEQLANVPALELTTEHWQSMDWDSWLQGAKLPDLHLKTRHFFNDFVMLQSAAEQGHGVALGWSQLSQEALQSGRLVRPFKRAVQAPPGWGYYLMPSHRGQHKPSVEAVMQWLLAQAQMPAVQRAANST